MKVQAEPIFDLKDVPTHFKGVQLSHHDRVRLSHGLKTSLLRDLNFGSTVHDAKISLLKDDQGELNVIFDPYRETLEIPDTMFGSPINDYQKEALLRGETVGPFSYKSSNYYFSIDNDLNSVSIISSQEKGIRDTVCGYNFSLSDKAVLESGQNLSTRIFTTDVGSFSAQLNCQVSANGDVNYTFLEYNEIVPEKVNELKTKFNQELAQKELQQFNPTEINLQELDNQINQQNRDLVSLSLAESPKLTAQEIQMFDDFFQVAQSINDYTLGFREWEDQITKMQINSSSGTTERHTINLPGAYVVNLEEFFKKYPTNDPTNMNRVQTLFETLVNDPLNGSSNYSHSKEDLKLIQYIAQLEISDSKKIVALTKLNVKEPANVIIAEKKKIKSVKGIDQKNLSVQQAVDKDKSKTSVAKGIQKVGKSIDGASKSILNNL